MSIRKALVAAMADISNPKNNAKNPHFRSTYADLTAVLGVVRPSLSEHGLAVLQTLQITDDEGDPLPGTTGQTPTVASVLHTTLIHESGEELDLGMYPIRPQKPDPQGVGSAITYARRYSLMAAFGLGAEDDDGNAASAPASRGAVERVRRATTRNGKPKQPTVDWATMEGVIREAPSQEALAKVAAQLKELDTVPASIRRLWKDRSDELAEDAARGAE